MLAQTHAGSTRFVRRTQLSQHEYRTNFRQIDCDVIAALTSAEACRITPSISRIYLALINAPRHQWEREGVLCFTGEAKDGRWLTAWEQLLDLLGVASATARKALLWMHHEGVIGYFAGKNGVGLRIFLNRASSSIGTKRRSTSEKIFASAHTSTSNSLASPHEAPFTDTFGVSEVLEFNFSSAPENGAKSNSANRTSAKTTHASNAPVPEQRTERHAAAQTPTRPMVSGKASDFDANVFNRLRRELETCANEAAMRAAERAAAREHERTREWLEKYGIPKATRVAQREAFTLLKSRGLLTAGVDAASAASEACRALHNSSCARRSALSEIEIRETAEAFVALLYAQGKPIEVSIAESDASNGGWLFEDDLLRVQQAARALMGNPGSSSEDDYFE